ncbi:MULTISPECIES: hypothetical protein [Prochlorococcus]|uniref:hypothetical protein n=1 Tax=Prochlorococcus TaxID=1218 RepID=UPI000533BD6B|nr:MULTISPECIES: hypothetical protein [Prochlorococcus]KGG12416.1 hypothetical protein EV05_1628 [Prochlorococcus sp. MIT 0601]
MNLNGKRTKKKDNPHYIFRGKSKRKPKKQLRQIIEASLMLLIGINLVLFLNQVPGVFDFNIFFAEIWLNVFESLNQLISSLAKISGAVIVFILLISSLFLIVGGTIRLLRILLLIQKQKSKPKDKV